MKESLKKIRLQIKYEFYGGTFVLLVVFLLLSGSDTLIRKQMVLNQEIKWSAESRLSEDHQGEGIQSLVFIFVFLFIPAIGLRRLAAMEKKEERESFPRFINGCSVEEIHKYLKGRSMGYLYRFKKLEKGKSIFNFSAALCGPVWFAYRLMWKEALALWAFSMSILAALCIFYKCAAYDWNYGDYLEACTCSQMGLCDYCLT